jgi:polysaccharide biosynthesis transport protein
VKLEHRESSAGEIAPRSAEAVRKVGSVVGTVRRDVLPARPGQEAHHGENGLMRQLGRQWKLLVAVSLIAGALGAVASLLLPEQYDAESKILVSVNAMQDASSLSQGNDFSQQRVQTYLTVATSGPVLEAVIDEMDLDLTPDELADKITAEAIPETALLRLVVRDTDASTAARIADTAATVLMARIDSLEQGDSVMPDLVRTVLVEPAAIPAEPSSPSVPRNAALALLVGLSASVLFVYLRSTLDARIRSVDVLTEGMGMTLLGKIPRDAAKASDPSVMTEYDPSGFSEAYRLLRTRMRYANADGKLNTIMFTSVGEGEGKSSVASLLATALAESGQRVLLIDADMRRPSISEKFGLESTVGLTAVLTRQATLQEAVQRSAVTGVDILAAGVLPPNPAELLESQSMRDLVREAGRSFDLVLIDTPPAASTADATTVSAIADAVLLVVRTDGKVTRHAVERVIADLSLVGSRVLGAVGTFVKADKSDAPSYY